MILKLAFATLVTELNVLIFFKNNELVFGKMFAQFSPIFSLIGCSLSALFCSFCLFMTIVFCSLKMGSFFPGFAHVFNRAMNSFFN